MFSSLGLLKRFVPFLLTFVVGILVASIFVPSIAPNINFKRNNWKKQQHRQHYRDQEAEIQRLRDQIADQEMELQMWREGQVDWNAIEPPMPPAVYMEEVPMPPPPPPAPVAPARRGR